MFKKYRTDVFKKLLKNKKEYEAILYLKKYKNYISINTNFKDIHGCNFLTYSISSQQYKLANALINNGADVDLEDGLNQLPLMYTFMELLQGEDCYDLIDVIIDKMSDINKRTIFDQTSLFFLFDVKYNENVKYDKKFRKLIIHLIKKGANFNLRNKADETIWDISKRENGEIYKVVKSIYEQEQLANFNQKSKINNKIL